MIKMHKILGQEGRITIPYEVRLAMQLFPGDVISFTAADGKTVIIKEKICENCCDGGPPPKSTSKGRKKEKSGAAKTPLFSYLDGLTDTEQMDAIVHLIDLRAKGRRREP